MGSTQADQKVAPVDLNILNFEEPYISPDQYWTNNRVRKSTPEKTLLLAVLNDAIKCYMKVQRRSRFDKNGISNTANGKKPYIKPRFRKERLAMEAEEWFTSDDYFIFSFNWLCDELDLNADNLWAGLKKIRKEKESVSESRKRITPRRKQFFSGPINFLPKVKGECDEDQG